MDKSEDTNGLLAPDAAAKRLGFDRRTLDCWRQRGGGPVYVRVSSRAVRYDPSDLDKWVDERKRSSTADPGPRKAA